MEKALGMRLIVCCLEVLPLKPFPFFVYCRMRCLILGLSVGRSVGIEKKAKKKKKKHGEEDSNLEAQYLSII